MDDVHRSAKLSAVSEEEVALVRLAAAVAASPEPVVRDAVTRAASAVRARWIEEVLLQSYLFAGFPRALNAMREWRRISGVVAPAEDEGTRVDDVREWERRGALTCAAVYGAYYEPLRRQIRDLHRALDSWMIVEGYGKVLSRSALDLRRRELCMVAACAAAGQDRQLHSHLHGALHAGASVDEVRASLDAIADLIAGDNGARYALLLTRVVGAHVH